MPTLIISNQRTEEMVGDLNSLAPDYRRYVGNQAQRMAWCLAASDVIVLPIAASENFLRYVTGLLGIDRRSVRMIVPPTGHAGDGVLSADRLRHPDFLRELRYVVAEHRIDRVMP